MLLMNQQLQPKTEIAMATMMKLLTLIILSSSFLWTQTNPQPNAKTDTVIQQEMKMMQDSSMHAKMMRMCMKKMGTDKMESLQTDSIFSAKKKMMGNKMAGEGMGMMCNMKEQIDRDNKQK